MKHCKLCLKEFVGLDFFWSWVWTCKSCCSPGPRRAQPRSTANSERVCQFGLLLELGEDLYCKRKHCKTQLGFPRKACSTANSARNMSQSLKLSVWLRIGFVSFARTDLSVPSSVRSRFWLHLTRFALSLAALRPNWAVSKKRELVGEPDTSIHSDEDSIHVSEISDYPVEIDE